MPLACASIQGVRDLNRQVEQRIGLKGLGLNTMLECLPLQELHHDEGLPFVLADLENGADVGVVERGSCARLALEALEDSGSRDRFSGRNLSATKRPSVVSSALYTTPIPPPPNFSRIL